MKPIPFPSVPANRPFTFHERAQLAASNDQDNLEEVGEFCGDCFVAPIKLGKALMHYPGGAVAAVVAPPLLFPFSTTLGILTYTFVQIPLATKTGVEILAWKLSK